MAKIRLLRFLLNLKNRLDNPKKQGQGKPTKIYVMNFSKPISKNNTKALQKIKSLTECKSKNKTSDITSKTAVQTSEKPKSEEKRAEVKTSKKPKSELDCSSTIPKSRLLKTEVWTSIKQKS